MSLVLAFLFCCGIHSRSLFPLQADLYHNQLISLSSFDSVASGTQFIPRSIMFFTSLSYILLRIFFFGLGQRFFYFRSFYFADPS